jgi:4,5-dihydroxyphthalate decarboxylase
LIVTVAAGPYAHLADLAHASAADGLELRHEVHEPGEIFRRMLREGAWDVAEMSLATSYILADRGDARFVGLPVFPSRTFRHSSLYVPAESPVRSAADLAGGRVGVLRYAMTTAVWIRELLAGQYGIPASGLRWFVGEDSPHPPSIAPTIVEGSAVLERMAVAGELDCLISGRTPAGFASGRLRRLFPRFGEEERAYYAATRVFPIMHTLVARRSLVEQHPGLVGGLMRRFRAAKHSVDEGLANFDISSYPVPWLPALVDEARRAFGGELWPYGIEPNRVTLNAFARALAAEGLTSRVLAPEEVFADG